MPIDKKHENLLIDLVEAERRVPREQRQHFYISRTIGPAGVQLDHEGWLDQERRVFEGDIEFLARSGLIAMSRLGSNLDGFYVTPAGFAYYAEAMKRRGQPIVRVQSISRDYISSDGFQRKYPSAYAKWAQAEALLWSSDSSTVFSTIGHLAREAMQEFASVLVDRFHPAGVDTDRAKTISRIRAVLNQQTATLEKFEKEFLDALLAYWGTVSDLVQRQEHGAQRETTPLVWEDARRVVFQVVTVMFELDRALSKLEQP